MSHIITNFKKFFESNEDIPYPIGSIIKRTYSRFNPEYFELVEYVGKEEYTHKTGGYKYFKYTYEAYPLKANLTEVKGAKTQVNLFSDNYNKSNRTSVVVLKNSTGTLVSSTVIASDNRRATEAPLAWDKANGEKPLFLYSKDEYKKEITPILKDYIKFISSNSQYFLTDYSKIKGMTLSEDVNDRFKYRFERDSIVEAPKNILDVKKAKEKNIEERLGVSIDTLTHDDVNSNKWVVKKALEDKSYEEMLKTGVINIKNVEEILASVKLKVPMNLYKVDTNVKELGIDKAKETEIIQDAEKFFNTIKTMFLEVHTQKVNGYINYYEPFLSKYSEFKNSYNGEEDINSINYALNVFITGEPPKIKTIQTRFGVKNTTEYCSFVKTIQSLDREYFITKTFNLNSDWKTILDKKALMYADDLFKFYCGKLINNFQNIDRVELPKVTGGELYKSTPKGFEAYLTFKYSNGFSFMVETDVIWAGGWNIQVEHLRGLFKYFYKGKRVSTEQMITLYNEF